MDKRKIPAYGEIRAIGGYGKQYLLIAQIIYKYLNEGNINWLKFVDIDAGALDDFQICRGNRIDAYQIKSSQYEQNITYNDLFVTKTKGKTLFNQLTEGWKKIKKNKPDRSIFVHLLTNNIPSSSSSQKIPYNPNNKPAQLHFASFYHDVLAKIKDLDFQVPEEWKFTLEEIKSKSDLLDQEFIEFITHFEIDFFPINILKEPDTRAGKIINNHIKEIANYVFDKIKNAIGTVEITSAQLIEEIGWEEKVTLKNPHEFPVDRSKYIPIESTIKELFEKINSLEKGYLALVGAPGTGKSTLLSELNSDLKFKSRIIRYYAFVPDSNKMLLRGEMNNFLFDLIKLLELEGFVSSTISEPDNTTQLFEKLNSVFEQIGNEYSKSGKKTIIVVDGLDHIEREEKPTRSFLSILPRIDKLPKGLIFLLGSQKIELNDLNFNIKKSLENGGIININPFSLSEVSEFLKHNDLSLKSEIISEITRVSEGHPTLLGIIVKNIREKPKNDILELLKTYEVYNGNLDIIYDQLWDQIIQEGVKNILGVLARLRREVDIQLIAKKTQQFKEIQELNDKFKHLFNVKGNYWSFYHNSFRLYLENKTAQFLSQYNEENNRSFHKQIVTFFEDSPDNFIEFIYHSYKADSLKNYLTDSSTSNFGLVFFRNLFFNFIHADNIEEVFQLCFKALKDNFQFKAFLTVLFSNLELDNRSFEYDIEEDLSLLFDTDNYNKALQIIYDGRTLRLSPSSALHYAYELFKREQNEIAYDIYSKTEPLTILRSKEAIDLDSRINLRNSLKFYDYRMWLTNWIKASYFVRGIQEVIDIIRNLNLKSERNEVSTRSLQNELLFDFGEVIFENCSEIEEYNMLSSCFDSSIDDDNDYLFWSKNRQAVIYRRLRDYKNETKILQEIIDYPKNEKLSKAQKEYVLELLTFRFENNKKAKELFYELGQVEILLKRSHDLISKDYSRRINYYEISLKLGFTKKEVLPKKSHDDDIDYFNFERLLFDIAEIRFKYKTSGISPILKDIDHIFYYYKRIKNENNFRKGHYFILRTKGELFEILLDNFRLFSKDLFEALINKLFKEWDDDISFNLWTPDTRRTIINSCIGLFSEDEVLPKHVSLIENHMLINQDVNGKIEQSKKQAKTWLKFGNKEKAFYCLQKALESSLGVGYRKDYQFNYWIDWLNEYCKIENIHGLNDIKWLSEYCVGLDDMSEHAGSDLADEILLTVFKNYPENYIYFYNYFFDNNLTTFRDNISNIILHMLSDDSFNYNFLESLYIDFYVPLSRNGSSHIAEKFLEKLFSTNNPRINDFSIKLINKVQVYSLEKNRQNYLEVIKSFYEKHSLNLIEIDGNNQIFNQVDLKVKSKAHKNITVSKEIVSYTLDLIQKSNYRSDYYNNDLNSLLQKCSSDDIYNLYNQVPEQKMDSVFVSALADILLKKGNINWAKEFGEKALKMSSASGWIEHYDGGSRLKSIELLQKINHSVFGLQSLLSDLGTGNAPIRDIALNLPKIFDSIDQEFNYKYGWLILKEFLEANLVFCQTIPIDKELVNTKEPPIYALLNWLFKFLDYPSSDLQFYIETTLLNSITESKEIIQFIENYLHNYNSNIQLRILQLLSAFIEIKQSDFNLKLEGELHNDFRIQFLLSKILKKQYSGLIQKKSAYYNLEIPDITGSDYNLKEYHSIIERNFSNQINYLIDATNLEAEKIYNRIYLFAANENVFDKYAIGQTSELEKDNRGNRIDLNHYHLDFLLIKAAIYKLIHELFKNGLLNEFHLPTITRLFMDFDPKYFFLERKGLALQINDEPDKYYKSEDWLNYKIKRKLAKNVNDKILLAADVEFRKLDWNEWTEYHKHVICSKENEELENLIEETRNIKIDNYIHQTSDKLFIHNWIINTHLTWLAINPKICSELGWQLADEISSFAWYFKDRLMVESVYYQNGSINHRPYIDTWCGSGWVVLSSKEAFEILKEKLGLKYIYCERLRMSRENNHWEKNEHVEFLKI